MNEYYDPKELLIQPIYPESTVCEILENTHENEYEMELTELIEHDR